MNIEYLHYFLDVAKTNSITQAAKLNFISPQGMSRAMGEFEKELGCDLLIRYSNKLSLSPVGKELVPKITEVVNTYASLLEAAATKSQPQSTDASSFIFDCQYIGMLAFLPNKVKDYIFGSESIHFRESANSQIRQNALAHLENGSSNASPFVGLMCFFGHEETVVREGIGELAEKGFAYRPYLKSYDVVMVNANSPLAAKTVLTDAEIASMPLVTSNSFLRTVLSKRFGIDAISFASTDFSLRRSLVIRGSAHSFLPAFSLLTMDPCDEYVLCNMERPYGVEIGFVGSEEGFADERFCELIRLLDEFYQAHLDSDLYTLVS